MPLAGWALFAAAAAGLAVHRVERPGPRASGAGSVLVRARFERADQRGDPAPVISPDGRRILVQAIRNGRQQLLLRDLAKNAVVPVAGTEGAGHPFFSPDGAWIAFAAEGKLRKVRVDGGSPITLAPSRWAGGSWGADGTIVYTERTMAASGA